MTDTQQQQTWQQQQQQQQPNGAYAPQAQPHLPFPTLLPSASPPQPLSAGSSGAGAGPGAGAWTPAAAPFPHILPPTLASGPPSQPLQQMAPPQSLRSSPPPVPTYLQQQQQHPAAFTHAQPPRLGAHVPVPASLLQSNITADDDDGPPPLEPVHGHHHAPSAAGHSHDGVACGHSHAGNASPNTLHARSSATVSASSSSASAGHGHSHGGGGSCSSDHGHSHAPSSAVHKVLPPVSWEEPVARPAVPLRRRLVKMVGVAWFGGGDARSVLVYITAKFAIVLLQLWWGLIASNLGMVSSSFHSAFDLMALSCALFAMLNAKYPARGTPFSYGLDRQEVVSAFTNAVFLFFVATFMIIETFHTAYSPPELEQSDVVVALVSLAVDALGLVLFNKYMTFRHASDESAVAVAAAAAAAAGSNTSAAGIWTHGGSSAPLLGSGSSGALVSSSSSSSTSGPVLLGANSARGHYENMHGVALHVMADLVGHASLLSAIWIHASFPSFTLIFALSFLLSALLTIRLVLPLFRATGAVLLMTTPVHLRLALDRAMREVSFYDGVLELRSAHWWTHAPGVVVGSMHVRIRSDAEEQTILAYVHSVLRKYCALLTVQIEKDQMPAHWNTHVLQS